ncbi:MAG TPA: relaxase/mobilization nuclease domain-containing protein, partial [Puia sp.]|nr:relaxase/mobilization nuclease domain-containing protein [Puia sp.]
LAPEDILQKWKMVDMAEQCAKEMGFEKNQYVAIYHKDTNHQHLHIVANRVGFDGKTVSDSHNYQKISKYCRKMEQKLQLKQVLSPRRYLSQKERLIERHDIRKVLLKEHVRLSIGQSKSFLEFEHRMKQLNYEVIKGRGIAFRDKQKVYTKGSDVGYSMATIEKKLKLQLMLSKNITNEQKQFLRLENKLKKEMESQENSRKQKQVNKLELKSDDNISEGKRHHQRQEQIMEILIRPVQDDEDVPYELRQSRSQRVRH